jgi:hypothetical protein
MKAVECLHAVDGTAQHAGSTYADSNSVTIRFVRYASSNRGSPLPRVADHIVPHYGEYEAFWHGPLQSLCYRCHDSTKQKIDASNRPIRYVVDVNGKPLDPNHPSNTFK